MAKKAKGGSPRTGAPDPAAQPLARDTDAPVAGIPGPGRWLIAEFQPTSLFSLKISLATSSVGRTLIVPTPYAIKMALIDAAFRAGFPDSDCASLLKALIGVDLRVSPGERAVVTHTFLKVRQESRDTDPLRPYTSTIAYRELVYQPGVWEWAFDLATVSDETAGSVVQLLPHVAYVGKRGSFVRFCAMRRARSLGTNFTLPIPQVGTWSPPSRAHIVPLDDFGPQADLAVLSSFTPKAARRGIHRKFVDTIVPLGIVNSGPGFTEYGFD